MEQDQNNAIFNFYKSLDRSKFMDINKESAHLDCALPIGYGQTVSQPTLVLQMTELLKPDKTCSVLEIGTGSGYQTAYLSEFCAKVYTIERIQALYLRTKARLAEMGYENITFIYGDGSGGCEAYSPYDRIIVTAASKAIPEELLTQLKPGGIMVIPVGNQFAQDLCQVTKQQDGSIVVKYYERVVFVPLVGKYSI